MMLQQVANKPVLVDKNIVSEIYFRRYHLLKCLKTSLLWSWLVKEPSYVISSCFILSSSTAVTVNLVHIQTKCFFFLLVLDERTVEQYYRR